MFENKESKENENFFFEEKTKPKNYSGQIAIAVYFKGYGDNFANDCRRFLDHEIISQFKEKLGTKFETILFVPKEYHLIRYIPIKDTIDEGKQKSKNRIVGKAKGGFEIYDVSGFDEELINALKLLLREKLNIKWFNFFKIYKIEEVI